MGEYHWGSESGLGSNVVKILDKAEVVNYMVTDYPFVMVLSLKTKVK